ncbi:MAG: uroporphyrinogen decarboxylase [Thermoguttaceae bacterium]|nr:uroporphyrinogen decarboxylase [Thermoguttaceae bacterium]MDW8077524.1 uroporphyrinogen decarboxylase [Thermoguttaceae bacterium]
MNSRFMRAARREPVDQLPVWLMRQAGRFMPEYRAIRGTGNFLDFCRDPQRCAQVMQVAVENLGVDAAILFSDLLVVLEPLGLRVEFPPDGPQVANPIRTPDDVKQLRPLESLEPLSYVLEAAELTRQLLPSHIPLIGFAGAPFTLASYAIEGSGSKSFHLTKRFMYQHEDAWFELLRLLGEAVTRFLLGQIAAGAGAVQIFDTWVGCLSPDDYRYFVLPQMTECFRALPASVPSIHFATGNPALVPLMAQAGGSVIGLDWRIRLEDAWKILGDQAVIQGNLDPAVLLGPQERIRRVVTDLLHQWAGRPGYIFNLGHGVLPQTPVENVKYLVRLVHEESRRILEQSKREVE